MPVNFIVVRTTGFRFDDTNNNGVRDAGEFVYDYDEAGILDPGDILTTRVTVTNSGSDAATNVRFVDNFTGSTLVANSLNISPIARNDSFTAIANVVLRVGSADTINGGESISVAGNLLTNDIASITGDAVPGMRIDTVTNGVTVDGGRFSIALDGSFSYVNDGNDTEVQLADGDSFTYTVRDAGLDGAYDTADDLLGTATVKISFATQSAGGPVQRVWFVDGSATVDGDGTSASPFRSTQIAAKLSTSATDADDVGHVIYVENSATGSLTLEADQKLIGTGEELRVGGFQITSDGGSNSVLNATSGFAVSLSTGNTIAGVNLGGTGGIFGSNFGTLTVTDDVVLNTTGGAALNLTTGTVAGTGFASTTSAGAGVAVRLSSVAGTVDLGSGGLSGATSVGLLNGSFLVFGGTANVNYSGSITQTAAAPAVNVHSGHSGTITLSGNISANAGTGLRFDNADGTYILNGTNNLNGGDAGIDITGGSGGTFTFGSGTSITSPTGIAFNVNNSTATVNYNGGITYGTAGTAMVSVTDHSGGTISFNGGVLNATNGTGLQFNNADGIYNFNNVNGATTLNGTATGGDTGVDIINGSNGTFLFGSNVSLNGASGTTFNVDGGGGDITFNGTLTDDVGQLIRITSRTGGTIDFNGAVSDNFDSDGGVGTTEGSVHIGTNTGGTVRFDGGLSLATGANDAFTATGNSNTTLVVSGAAVNRLATTTGTALDVQNTTIGSGGLVFQSISANGGVNGIVLNTTGSTAGLTVTGTGAAFTGGTIQNTSDAGISLNSTVNVSLDRMSISSTGASGINGKAVTNFQVTNSSFNNNGNLASNVGAQASESAIAFNGDNSGLGNNLAGTVVITGNTITNPFYSGIDIRSDAGTINSATISNNNITNPGFSGVNIVGTGNTSTVFRIMDADIHGNIINGSGGNGIQVDVGNASTTGGPAAMAGGVSLLGNGQPGSAGTNQLISIRNNSITLDSSGTQAITVASSANSSTARTQFNFEIVNNGTLTPLGSSAIGTVILVGNNGFSDMAGVVSGNVIAGSHTVNGGGGNGIGGGNGAGGAGTGATPRLGLTLDSNVISGIDGNGILLVGRGASGDAFFRVVNNNVAAPVGSSSRPGIRIDAGNTSSVDDDVYLEISGNTSQGSGTSPGIGVRKQGTVQGTNEFGIEGLNPSPASFTAAEDYITSQNPGSEVGTSADGVTQKRAIVLNGDNFSSATVNMQAAAPPPAELTQELSHLAIQAEQQQLDRAGTPSEQPQDEATDTTASDTAATDTDTTTTDTTTTEPTPPTPAPAAPTAPQGPTVVDDGVLSQAELDLIVEAAIARWEAAGVTPEQVAAMRAVAINVADLSGLQVGKSNHGAITIDADAAGWSWFVDATPLRDEEYAGSGTRLAAIDRLAAPGTRLDLLTVVMHELGHQIGLRDEYDTGDVADLMYGMIAPGERRLPGADDVQASGGEAVTGAFAISPVDLGTIDPGSSFELQWRHTVDSPTEDRLIGLVRGQSTISYDDTPADVDADRDTAVSNAEVTGPVDGLTLGGLIYVDADKGGTLTDGDGRLDGVVLGLYADTNDSGGYDDGDLYVGYNESGATLGYQPDEDTPAAPGTGTHLTTTSTSSVYNFYDLAPGDYIVRVMPVNFADGGVLAGKSVFPTAGNPNDNSYDDQNGQQFAGFVATRAIRLDYGQEVSLGGDTDHNDTLDIAMVEPNKAPEGGTPTRAINEDGSYTFAVSDFGFTDTDGGTFKEVVITTLPAADNGILALDGVAVTAGQAIAVADIPKLVFTPTANGFGADYGNFTFQVRDDGGTDAGGQDTDQSANTFTINVTGVNDAPSLTPGDAVTVDEDAGAVTVANWASAITAGPNESSQGLTISTSVLSGTLAFAQAPSVNVVSGNLTFRTAANSNGTATVRVTITDDGGTPANAADDLSQSYDFTITANAVNDAPVLSQTPAAAVTYTEGQVGGAALLQGGSVFDADAANFAGGGLTVSVNGTGNSLSLPNADGFSNQGAAGGLLYQGTKIADIAATADSITLTNFTAAMTPAVMNLLLDNFRYAATGDAPNTADRIVTFTLNDGGNSGGAAETGTITQTVQVVAVNDAPSGTDKTVATNEDTPRLLSEADFGFTDVDGNSFAGVVITTLPANARILVDGAPIAAGTLVTATQLTDGKVSFAPNSNVNGATSFTFQVVDSGNTASGGQNTDQLANTFTVNITPVNDAPTIANLQGDTIEIVEDSATQLFIDLGTDAVITDPDSGNFNGGSLTFQVTAGLVAGKDRIGVQQEGNVTLSGQSAGSVVSVGGVAIGTLAQANFGTGVLTVNFNSDDATAARVQLLLRAFEFVNTSDDPVAGQRTVTVTLVDGDGGSDRNSYTTIVNVTAVNDTPFHNVPGAQTMVEDGVLTFSAANGNAITIGDVDAGASAIQVTVSAPNGALTPVATANVTITGSGTSSVTLGGNLADINTALNGLTYAPPQDDNGSRALTVLTNDLGATGNGGPKVEGDNILVNVTAVNDTPVNTLGATVTTAEDSAAIALTGMSIADVDADPATDIIYVTFQVLSGKIQIRTDVAGGIVLNDIIAEAVDTIQVFTTLNKINATLAADNGLTYAPNLNFNGNDTLTVQTNDAGATGADPGLSGEATNEEGVATRTITVTPVDDAPTSADKTATMAEDGTYVFAASDFPFNDVDGNTFAGITILDRSPRLFFDADGAGGNAPVAVAKNQFISAADITAGKLTFVPTANENGVDYDGFTFAVSDNGSGTAPDANTSTGYRFTFDVTAVNDAPTVTIFPRGGPLAPGGGEILVNTATAGDQDTPRITALANGGFVVTWQDLSSGNGGATGDSDNSAIKAQVFAAGGTPVGDEILVNSATANAQSLQQITALSDGGFVVTWQDTSQGAGGATGDTSDFAIKAQVFAADGTPVPGEILVNSATERSQVTPQITALVNGGFVVTWQDESQGVGGAAGDTSTTAIKARVFAAGGTPVAGEFLVNTATESLQFAPRITALSGGGFVVTWTDLSQGNGGATGDDNSFAVKAQVFAAGGTPVGGEILVNTATFFFQANPEITALSNGGFVVTWPDLSQGVGGASGDTNDYAVKAQVFSAGGTPLGSEILVNTATLNSQDQPQITALANGGFVVTWRDDSQGAGGATGDTDATAIKAQVFAAGGTPLGGEILVNSATADAQYSPQITALSTGGFVVTWQDDSGMLGAGPGDASPAAVKAQIFAANGTRVGSELLVNTATANSQDAPQIRGLANGGFVVTWTDGSQGVGGTTGDSQGNAIKAQVFTPGRGKFTATEQTPLDLKGTITVADIDAGSAVVNATLAAPYGTINVAVGTSGATLVGPNGTGSVVVSGTIDQLNALLNSDTTSSLTYIANTDAPPGTTTFTITVNDNGNSGGGAQTGSASENIAITPVNDAPALTAPTQATIGYTENAAPTALMQGVSLSDVDMPANFAGGSISLTVSGTGGGINLRSGSDFRINSNGDNTFSLALQVGQTQLGIGQISGIGTNNVQITNLISPADTARLNNLIDDFTWRVDGEAPTPGNRTVTLTFNDGGNIGGGALTASQTQTLAVSDENDAPVNSVPGAQTGEEDSNLTFSVANGNAITLADADAAALSVTLSVANGRLLLGNTAGISVTGGANGSATMTISGTVAALNTALNGLIYRGNLNYNGTDTLTITTDDGGANGSGGSKSDSDTVQITLAADGTIDGDAGNNSLNGTPQSDLFLLEQGGEDTVNGLAGDDGFYLGGALSAGDQLNGGDGALDTLGLQGNYGTFGAGASPFVLAAGHLVNIEILALLPGSDTRFANPNGASYSYNLKTVDENVAAGQRLVVNFNTLRAGENVTFDGSAEQDGFFLTYGGFGDDRITGGAGDDGFYFGAGRFGAGDRVDGGAGAMDQLGLQGDYSGGAALTFGANQLSNVEFLVLMTAADARFGGNANANYNYDLTMSDGNVAAGGRLVISANMLIATETLKFNGSDESNGSFLIFSGDGADLLVGGQGGDEINGRGGNDRITGGLGADKLRGGDGSDAFVFATTDDSRTGSIDQILDFAQGDTIDLSGIDANVLNGSGDDAFRFIGSSTFTGAVVGAGELRAVKADGIWTVEGDVNGDGSADFVLLVTTADPSFDLSGGSFVP